MVGQLDVKLMARSLLYLMAQGSRQRMESQLQDRKNPRLLSGRQLIEPVQVSGRKSQGFFTNSPSFQAKRQFQMSNMQIIGGANREIVRAIV